MTQQPYTTITVDGDAMMSGPMSTEKAKLIVADYQDINPGAVVIASHDCKNESFSDAHGACDLDQTDTRWTATFERGSEWHIVDRETFGTVAKVGNPSSIADRADEANARLIAAAPSMYEALVSAVAELERVRQSVPLFQATLTQAQDAILLAGQS